VQVALEVEAQEVLALQMELLVQQTQVEVAEVLGVVQVAVKVVQE
jgi:hypothetical protein